MTSPDNLKLTDNHLGLSHPRRNGPHHRFRPADPFGYFKDSDRRRALIRHRHFQPGVLLERVQSLFLQHRHCSYGHDMVRPKQRRSAGRYHQCISRYARAVYRAR